MSAAASPQDLDLAGCSSLQQEEWQVLESIYPDCVSSDISSGSVKLEIPVEFSEARTVSIENDHTVYSAGNVPPCGSSCGVAEVPHYLSLTSLPPLLLDVLLPPSYPYHPPIITSLHATNSWLPLTLGLQRRLIEMWQDGEGVLYTWVEWIRSGEFLDALDLTAYSSGESVIHILHPAPHVLFPLLKAYDKSTQFRRFSQTSYTCEICLTSIKGARCILLSCSHVFCRACLEDFWKLCIAEGDVGRVGCPDPHCVKAGREANEEEVRRVVIEEEVRRWKWLREKRELEKDPSIIHCPMAFCQRPVRKPSNVDEGSGWERLRTCTDCGYSFCAYCKRSWHGPLLDCPVSATESFVLEYLALPEDSPERVLMERRFGRTNMRKLVAKYEEEQANKRWLEQSTMECPRCHVHVEKSLGCNHMTCAKCRQHFCYRCGEKLLAQNPYVHFSTPGKACYSRLFDFQSVEDAEWQPVEGFDLL
ncbi:RWD-domain-containing protein [Laetiporus sulphureus 93-53]|uniref:RBR-type E3 ubiquitin transferase n=1 Tax=Laetiporus sulphureus 93-53 TaxID=1314785 RepID=A0A165ECW3_9APHY|nr:RWD-domain-containing protein [Laetiporus sulphureus 93-53]KZT06754.1 RWD-domain-containing protein [Laetiporus sulphureus 93-53]